MSVDSIGAGATQFNQLQESSLKPHNTDGIDGLNLDEFQTAVGNTEITMADAQTISDITGIPKDQVEAMITELAGEAEGGDEVATTVEALFEHLDTNGDEVLTSKDGNSNSVGGVCESGFCGSAEEGGADASVDSHNPNSSQDANNTDNVTFEGTEAGYDSLVYTYELDKNGEVIPDSITQLGDSSKSMAEGESMGSVNYDSDGNPLLLVIPNGGAENGANAVSGDLTVNDDGELVSGDKQIDGLFSHEDTAGDNFKWEKDDSGNIIGVGIEDLTKGGSGQYAYDGDFNDIELSFGKTEAGGDATTAVEGDGDATTAVEGDGDGAAEETMAAPLTAQTLTQPAQTNDADEADGGEADVGEVSTPTLTLGGLAADEADGDE